MKQLTVKYNHAGEFYYILKVAPNHEKQEVLDSTPASHF